MNRNDLRRVDMNLLVIFEALMFEKNLTRVAEKLFMGQPAVSAALGRLRDLFDDPLLLRNGRGMEPTPRAVAILKELQPAMDTISGAVSRAKDFDPSTSCACSASVCPMTPSSACFRRCLANCAKKRRGSSWWSAGPITC